MRKEVATSVNVETITTRDHIEARMKAGYKVSLTKLAKMLQGRRKDGSKTRERARGGTEGTPN